MFYQISMRNIALLVMTCLSLTEAQRNLNQQYQIKEESDSNYHPMV